jgi:hypothetical protein
MSVAATGRRPLPHRLTRTVITVNSNATCRYLTYSHRPTGPAREGIPYASGLFDFSFFVCFSFAFETSPTAPRPKTFGIH